MKSPFPLVAVASCTSTVASGLNITTNMTLTVPESAPPFAKAMDPSLSSLSLEFQYWPVYAGNASNEPNQYFNQLLRNLGERTGKTPVIRIGGTSQNNAYIDDSFQVWNESHIDEVYGPFTHRSNTSIGKDWYVIAGNLPAGTELTFGLNLFNNTQVAAQTRRLAEAFQGARAELTKNVTLESIQIGNEPNIQFRNEPNVQVREEQFEFYFPTAEAYVSHWHALAHTVLRNIEMGGDGNPLFWIGSEVNGYTWPFTLTGSLEAGILNDREIANTNAILEEHHCSGAGLIGAIPGGPPPGTLMDKESIRANLSDRYRGMLNAQSYNRTYYLGEANSYAGEAILGLSNTGECAIWTVDYMLQAATMGIQRVYLHSTPNRMFAVLQPGWGFTNGTGIQRPHIMPMYNGLLVVNEMVGTSGNAMVAEIENNNVALSSYGVWENGKLSRMAILNSNVYEPNGETRTGLNVTLSGVDTGRKATIKRLSIPHTTASKGITWAGQSFETDGGVPSGNPVEDSLEGGSVTVGASEVVLLSFN